jgi:hypothetical protein
MRRFHLVKQIARIKENKGTAHRRHFIDSGGGCAYHVFSVSVDVALQVAPIGTLRRVPVDFIEV